MSGAQIRLSDLRALVSHTPPRLDPSDAQAASIRFAVTAHQVQTATLPDLQRVFGHALFHDDRAEMFLHFQLLPARTTTTGPTDQTAAMADLLSIARERLADERGAGCWSRLTPRLIRRAR